MYEAQTRRQGGAHVASASPATATGGTRRPGAGPLAPKPGKIDLAWVSKQVVDARILPLLREQPFWQEFERVAREVVDRKVDASAVPTIMAKVIPWIAHTFRFPTPQDMDYFKLPEYEQLFVEELESGDLPDFEDLTEADLEASRQEHALKDKKAKAAEQAKKRRKGKKKRPRFRSEWHDRGGSRGKT